MSSDNYDAAMEAYAEETATYRDLGQQVRAHPAMAGATDARRYLASRRLGLERSWRELRDAVEMAADGSYCADEHTWTPTLAGDGEALSSSEVREWHDYHRHRTPVENARKAILTQAVRMAEWRMMNDPASDPFVAIGCCWIATDDPLPGFVERALKRAVVAAIAAAAEWCREPLEDDGYDDYDGSVTLAELAELARLADQSLRWAAALARRAGDVRAAQELAAAADDLRGLIAEIDAEPVDSPETPTPRALAPPGRRVAAQPILATAPPAVRVRVAA